MLQLKNLLLCLLITTVPQVQLASPIDGLAGGEPAESLPAEDFTWTGYATGFFSDHVGQSIVDGFDATGWTILASGIALTSIAYNNDRIVQRKFREDELVSDDVIKFGAVWGSGGPAIITALGLIYFDRPAGLALAETIAFTSATHYPITIISNRRRPGNPSRKNSFPSGHTANAFALASSLSYSYGWTAAVPGFIAAVATGAARIADDRHWISDTVMGATIGYFWGRATSFHHHDEGKKLSVLPVIEAGNYGLRVSYGF